MPLPLNFVLFYVPPRDVYKLICASKEYKDEILGNQHYWARVAAHNLWRNVVGGGAAFRRVMFSFDYTDYYMVFKDNYNEAMEQFWGKLVKITFDNKWSNDETSDLIRGAVKATANMSNKERVCFYLNTNKYWTPHFGIYNLEERTEPNFLELLKKEYKLWKESCKHISYGSYMDSNAEVSPKLYKLLRDYDAFEVEVDTKRQMFEVFARTMSSFLSSNVQDLCFGSRNIEPFLMTRTLHAIVENRVQYFGLH